MFEDQKQEKEDLEETEIKCLGEMLNVPSISHFAKYQPDNQSSKKKLEMSLKPVTLCLVGPVCKLLRIKHNS